MANADPQTTPGIVGATLLVVDDDSSFRRALRRVLELEGISIVEAPNGEQAIRVIGQDAAYQLDAVLTDVTIPDVSGPELIAVLLECAPALPVVAMSGLLRLPPDLPPVPLLHKPFEPQELIETVAPLILRSQEMRRQARQARQMRADAAESRSLAKRQQTRARDQQAKTGDLRKALMQLRERMKRR